MTGTVRLGKSNGKISMQSKLWKMILIVTIPLMLVIVVVASIGTGYALQYNAILNNVTTASDFNRDFKKDVDLKMYYYVIDSQYSEGLPLEEVQSAETIASKLIETTTEKNSLRAVGSVLNLCHNLKDKMQQIADTQKYDSRMDQLSNNIYVTTELIQEYMYTYLYYEAVHLDVLQTNMITNMVALMAAIVALALALLIFLLGYSRKLSRRIVDPIVRICERLEAIGKGGLLVCEPIQADVEEVQLLSDGIESMVGRLKQQIDKNAEQEKQRRRTMLALLQAQMNPHFLYNTLDTIIWLIESGEINEAVAMISSLSNYFRFSLSRGQNVITLEEEQQHIRSYLEIQQMRYRDMMEYEIDIPDELKCYILPKLTLQPLVENALYHGIKISRRKGFIRVTGRAHESHLILEVTDDGFGMQKERLDAVRASLVTDSREGFGLRTVHQRIQILFGKEYGLTIDGAPDAGVKVLVTMPMKKNDGEMKA
ncbi:MAG: sensor histidine kinase [Clostridiales bacterium]|nr:sensor histidine kinase [Clostridiales bacterium]